MDFATARRKMVDNQVRPNDVTEPLLISALLDIPRERFAPADRAAMAYMDNDLVIGDGRALLKPMVLARLIQAADIQDTDHVLDVACGTGYSTAVLARLAHSVTGLEENPTLAAQAARLLSDLAVANASVATGPLAAGWTQNAPYDVILINGAVERIPQVLLTQLKEDGRLLAVVSSGPIGKATIYQRVAGDISTQPVFDAAAPLLKDFVKPPEFVF
ncbi:MAG: protein-L-isoaspartate O-methyltransferase [Xanthobacteraceae bacterium]